MALSLVEVENSKDSQQPPKNFVAVAKTFAAKLNRLHGSASCTVLLFSTDKNRLLPVCRVGDKRCMNKQFYLRRQQYPNPFRYIERHSYLAASAVRLHPATSCFNSEFFIPEGIHSLLAVALIIDDENRGIVSLEFDKPTRWDAETIADLEHQTQQLAKHLDYRDQLDFVTRHQLLRFGIDNSSQQMFGIDAETEQVIYVNDAYTQLENMPVEALIGLDAKALKLLASFEQRGSKLFEQVRQNGYAEGETSLSGENGETLWCLYRMTLVTANKREFILVESGDITQQRQYQTELEDLAWNCQLTGVYNRAKFIQQVGDMKLLLHADVNGFRRFNDVNGETIGDEVLRTLAERLRECSIRYGGKATYRLGADEFIIGFTELPTYNFQELASLVRQYAQQEIAIDDQIYRLQLTVVGLDLSILSDEVSPLAALDMAAVQVRDGALYQLYDEKLQSQLLEQAALEFELRSAVDGNQLILHYQPLVCAKQQRITGAEALIRWQHPDKGLLFPGSFIDIAERSNLIEPIGRWVLESALQQLHQWQKLWPELTVHVNVSVKQLLSEEFYELCWRQLTLFRVKRGSLVLEITENTLMEDVESVSSLCEQLGELGLVLAIDDFGTGYSSMSYLKQLPVQKLKIDRTFVADLEHSKESRQIVPAIVAMGRSLGLSITAEGVEDKYQDEFLRSQGCDEMQGYYYSKPITISALEQKLCE